MAEELILEILGAIRGDIAEIKLDILDVKKSLIAFEFGIADWAATQSVWQDRSQQNEAGLFVSGS